MKDEATRLVKELIAAQREANLACAAADRTRTAVERSRKRTEMAQRRLTQAQEALRAYIGVHAGGTRNAFNEGY